MIQDALCTFATAQSNTQSVAHTDIIDARADGNDYTGCYFVFQVSSAFTQTGTTSRLNVQLQTSDTVGFTDTDDITMVASATWTASQLTAGRMWMVRIPPGAKRYIRAFNVVSRTIVGHSFDVAAWNSFLVPDTDVRIDRRNMIGY